MTTTYRRIPMNATRAEYRQQLRAERKARVKAIKLKTAKANAERP